jgi:RNA-directed DNA polymerase
MAKSAPRPTSLRLARPRTELLARFQALQSRKDVADLLDVRLMDVAYYAVRAGTRRYRSFEVRKRRGAGMRMLHEPTVGLKIIQQKILEVLSAVYEPPEAVHGFVEGRSVASNALVHEGAREVLNVDLVDFFGSINFGRVWGLMRSAPYSLPHDAATVLAQLVTYENQLPQGAPSSPIVSNMVARSLDRRLTHLASRHRLRYTRYADDLTFSGDRIPLSWLETDFGSKPGEVVVGGPLADAIERNGFTINRAKSRLMRDRHRKVVTGLVVNRRVNVARDFSRTLRARLHAWEEFGEESAEAEWEDQRDRRGGERPRFRDVVAGQLDFLAMVRGNDDPRYERYYTQFCRLSGTPYSPIHERAWNHLARPDDAMWVLECSDSGHQGTAFFLEGFGLVTCEHVLGPSTVAFSPKRPHLRQPVTVLAKDRNTDLAILEVARPFDRLLRPFFTPPSPGQDVRARGYPDYNPGTTLWDGHQTVSGRRRYGSVDRITLSAPLFKGMSGGALMDRQNRVLGVIATDESLYNSVIPISALIVLAVQEGLQC